MEAFLFENTQSGIIHPKGKPSIKILYRIQICCLIWESVAKNCPKGGFLNPSLFMIHEKYRDAIKVFAIFNGKSVRPYLFDWHNRRYTIDKVLNIHSIHDGRERIHYFSVANDTDFFRLELCTNTLQWFLIEHYQE